MIRIMVVDDHPIVRQGLIAALEDESDFQVVGAAESAEAAEALVGRLRPEVVLLDLELPGMSGVEAIPRLLAASPGTRVLIFTAYDTDERVLGAIRSGAKGYLLKGATASDIAGAIRAVASGGSALEPRVAAKLIAAVGAPRGAGPLTRREREVLRLIADGNSYEEVAKALFISPETVRTHVGNAVQKLGVRTRMQAVATALRQGLIS